MLESSWIVLNGSSWGWYFNQKFCKWFCLWCEYWKNILGPGRLVSLITPVTNIACPFAALRPNLARKCGYMWVCLKMGCPWLTLNSNAESSFSIMFPHQKSVFCRMGSSIQCHAKVLQPHRNKPSVDRPSNGARGLMAAPCRGANDRCLLFGGLNSWMFN